MRTQGHLLAVPDLLNTLAVEATIHHLDLVRELPDAAGPATEGLTEARRVVDGLLGLAPGAGPGWKDVRAVLVAIGRAEPTPEERRDLGPAFDRLPVLA